VCPTCPFICSRRRWRSICDISYSDLRAWSRLQMNMNTYAILAHGWQADHLGKAFRTDYREGTRWQRMLCWMHVHEHALSAGKLAALHFCRQFHEDARFDALAALGVALCVGVALAAAGAQEAQAAAPHVPQDALGLLNIRVDLCDGNGTSYHHHYIMPFVLGAPSCREVPRSARLTGCSGLIYGIEAAQRTSLRSRSTFSSFSPCVCSSSRVSAAS
jgi:hypothetical protein